MKHAISLILLIITALTTSCEKDEYPPMIDSNDVCSSMDDIYFMWYCYDNFDIDNNGKVSIAEAKKIKSINLMRYQYTINTLEGIQYFTSIIHLDCNTNMLTSLDISKNTMLRSILCNNNMITSLDISKNLELEFLHCNFNMLTSLNVSKNAMLQSIECSNNMITSLDISKNKKLEYLNCDNTKLTSLDISNNSNMKYFICYNNPLLKVIKMKRAQFDNVYIRKDKHTQIIFVD